MSILDSVKGKLNFGRKDRWDDDYDDEYGEGYDDYGDDYEGDYDDYPEEGYDRGYDDDYGYERDEPERVRDGVAAWPEQLDGGPRRESRLSEVTPLVSNSDVRSKSYEYSHRNQQRNVSRPDYETSLQQYDIKPRDYIGRISNHSEESLSAARQELEALQRGEEVPLNSLNAENRPTASIGAGQRRSSYSTSAVSRRIVTVVPTSYEDAAQVAEAFRNGSSAVIAFTQIRPELAKRLLDFSFGVVSVSGGSVEKIGDKVFFLSRGGVAITETEKQQLRDAGII